MLIGSKYLRLSGDLLPDVKYYEYELRKTEG